jgi:Cu/Ag efflux protein CusF
LNARTQTVTLRGVDYTVDLRVPDKNQFKAIKVGDQVQAIFTEAVAISMEPAGRK